MGKNNSKATGLQTQVIGQEANIRKKRMIFCAIFS
jgi:hypothetical protein